VGQTHGAGQAGRPTSADKYQGYPCPAPLRRVYYAHEKDVIGESFNRGGIMLQLDTEAELTALHTGNVKESLYLEYKASGAVDKKDDTKKLEIARDVSAFANSVGGQIIYAMTEKDHEPAGLDNGVDPKVYPTLWFEQILQQHVTPNILNLDIKHVPLSTGLVAVRINIPAGTGDPHQVSDGKYYRRHNFNRLAMDHYEIKGLFYRVTTPDLFVTPSLIRGDNAPINFASQQEMSLPVQFDLRIGNRSSQPAMFTVIQIGFESRVTILACNGFEKKGIVGRGADAKEWITFSIIAPQNLPLFKEVEAALPTIQLGFHSSLLSGANLLKWAVKTVTPGNITHKDWFLHQEGGLLTLREPA
jgi:hypothetical protein